MAAALLAPRFDASRPMPCAVPLSLFTCGGLCCASDDRFCASSGLDAPSIPDRSLTLCSRVRHLDGRCSSLRACAAGHWSSLDMRDTRLWVCVAGVLNLAALHARSIRDRLVKDCRMRHRFRPWKVYPKGKPKPAPVSSELSRDCRGAPSGGRSSDPLGRSRQAVAPCGSTRLRAIDRSRISCTSPQARLHRDARTQGTRRCEHRSHPA